MALFPLSYFRPFGITTLFASPSTCIPGRQTGRRTDIQRPWMLVLGLGLALRTINAGLGLGHRTYGLGLGLGLGLVVKAQPCHTGILGE